MSRRLFYKSNDFNIVEFSPAPRMIGIDIQREDQFVQKIHRKFYLGLPYIQLAQLDRGEEGIYFFASCTKTPIKTLDDAIGVPLLPNIHPDLSVLMPDMPHPDIQVNIDSFFSSYFTDRDSLEWPGIKGVSELFGSYEEWENQTKIDPKFILTKPMMRPINPVIDGMPYQRSIRYSDIPKMKEFMVRPKNEEDNEEDDPVQDLLDQIENENNIADNGQDQLLEIKNLL